MMDSATKAAVSQFMALVSAQYPSKGCILFGSRARATFRPDSDADLAVLLEGSKGDFTATKLAMADIAYDVLLDTGIRIQPLPVWSEEWEHPAQYPNPRLLENIDREGIRL